MKNKRISKVFFMIILAFGLVVSELFSEQFVKRPAEESKDTEQFLRLRKRMQKNIRASEKSKINFALAEYYFKINDVIDSRMIFEEYVNQNPPGASTILANVYLYKIAKYFGNEKKLHEIKKELFQDRFILLFEKYKTLKYTSVFKNKYEIHYFIDRIDIFLNGELFEQVTP